MFIVEFGNTLNGLICCIHYIKQEEVFSRHIVLLFYQYFFDPVYQSGPE